MGHALGKNVLAEGVETEEAMKLLKEMGCDCVQGYYISRPVPKRKDNRVTGAIFLILILF